MALTVAAGGINQQVTASDGEETVTSLRLVATSLQGTVDCLVFCHSSASPSNASFRDLRTRLTQATCLYRNLHLPLSTQLVKNLSNLMALYDVMDAPTFCQHIQVVAHEVKRHADHASKVINVHVRLLADLNKLHMDAQSTLDMLLLEAKSREEQAEAYAESGRVVHKQEKRNAKMLGGVGALMAADAALFAGTPVISAPYAAGVILYGAWANHCLGKAKDGLQEYKGLSVAEREEAEMAYKAADIIRDPLTAAVRSFIQGIGKIAGFLGKLEGDVSNYAENVRTMSVNRDTMVIYLNLIKSQSAKIREACADYLEVMPAVEGRLEALSGIGASDPNYAKKWLTLNFPGQNPATIYKLEA